MSTQPLALAIRLAGKQEERETETQTHTRTQTEGEKPAAALKAHVVENAGLAAPSSAKGGAEDGRGNLRFWLRDIKIAESLYTVSAPRRVSYFLVVFF